ncbi:MAG: sodium:calcium antiporter [Candidatus Shapirobacteria bacterium]
MIILQIVALAVLFGLLSLSTRLLIDSFKKITSQLKIGEYALSNLIIATGTSIPELIIALECVAKNKPDLSFGNVLGSNIADLSLVIGGATLLSGSLKVVGSVVKHDIYYAFLISAAPLLLISDGVLSRPDGVILLSLYFAWQALMFAKKSRKKTSFWSNLKEKAMAVFIVPRPIITLIISIALLIGSADFLVKISLNLARELHIPDFILGVFILGVGSSLPELAFESRAIKNKESAIALGDLLGSIVANASLILGITAVLAPITIFRPQQYFTITLYFLITFFLFYTFIKTKHILERWEAAFLVASYFILLALEFG